MGPRRALLDYLAFSILSASFILSLTGCANQKPQPPTTQTLTPSALAETPTPLPPTPTSEPVAATINGDGVTIVEYNAELARYLAAFPNGQDGLTQDEQKTRVIDSLIDDTLLAQAAFKEGFSLTDGDLDARIQDLSQQIGGSDALASWEASQGYTDAELRTALRRSAGAAWKRDQIEAGIPQQAEQVHAQQIFFTDQADADAVYGQLTSGTDFQTLADQYEPVGGGDLGWFPKGYLTLPEVEEAAFALQAGEVSPVVHSTLGYHIIQVIERDPQRNLTPDARSVLQAKAVKDWLAEARSQAAIVLTLP